MSSISDSFIVLGFALMLVGFAMYAIFLGRFRGQLHHADPTLYFQLGFDAGTLMLTSYGTREAQGFLFQRRYKQHPDVAVRKLGSSVYGSLLLVVLGLLIMVCGALFQ